MNFQEVVHSALIANAEVAKHHRFAENRMDTHKNAPLTPKGREAMVRSVTENELSKAAAARQFNTTPKTVAKWVERFRAEGVDGLRDRSSRPLSLPSQTAPATCAAVEALRRQRYPGSQIAAELGVSPATVSRVLRQLGLNRLSALEPAEPIRRYEREHPGEIIRLDIKNSAVSSKSVTASPATAKGKATVAASAGNTCISQSMITRVWLAPKSCPTKSVVPACAFSLTRCASSEPMASRCIVS